MIIEVKMYTVACDNCGKEYKSDEYSAFATTDYAEDEARENDWIEEEGKHYCSECYQYDDEDNLIIITERSKK